MKKLLSLCVVSLSLVLFTLAPVHAWSFSDAPITTSFAGTGYPEIRNTLTDVAFDSSNNMVLYIGGGKFKKYNSSMQEIAEFSVPSGDEPGQLSQVVSMAFDSNNNLYITGSKYNGAAAFRVTKLSSNGTYVTEWGSQGTALGQFGSTSGIVVDSQDYVYVSDRANNRIQKFTTTGTPIAATTYGQGAGDGQLNGPSMLAVDSNDNIFVSDQLNHRVQKYNSSLVYQTKFGTQGSGNGQFYYPNYIDVDSQGYVYVADGAGLISEFNIQKFNNSGVFQALIGSPGETLQQYYAFYGLTIDNNDKLFVPTRVKTGEYSTYTVIKTYDTSGNFIEKVIEPQFGDSHQIAFDSTGNMYVSNSDYLNIVKFDTNGNLVKTYSYTDQWMNGVTITAADKVVGVGTDGSVTVFNQDGTVMTHFDTFNGGDVFGYAYTAAADTLGNYYVIDADETSRVIKFNASNSYVSQITANGATAFSWAEVIAVDQNDNSLYVLDSGNNRVQKFDASGNFLLEFAGNNGDWDYPEAMTVDTQGNVYIGDTYGSRIQVFNSTGVFQGNIDLSTLPDADQVVALGVDSTGVLYIADHWSNRLFTLAFDRINPSVAINSFPSDTTNDPTPTFTGTATDASTMVTNVEYSFDSTPGVWNNCSASDGTFDELSETYSCTPVSGIVNGSDTVYIRATDSRTNTSSNTANSYSFTVSSTATTPTVSTGVAGSVTSTTAVVSGNVASDGGDTVTERGVVYSSSNAVPTLSDSKQTTSGTTGAMSVALSNLTPATHYYIRTYAITGAGVGYGAVIEFTTLVTGTAPTVTTGSSSNVDETTATVAGNVTSDGGATITERGIVYSTTNATPTTADSKQITTGTTGSMTVNLSGLTRNVTYYARAYATNAQGTSYGSVVTFKTLEPLSLRRVYFTFGKFKYNKYVSPAALRTGDTAYLKNYNTSQLKLLQVFLYDYAKKGNQGFTKSKVTTTSMYLRTSYLLPTGKRYAYVMKFQDKATGIIATKYFVVYTTKVWNGQSTL